MKFISSLNDKQKKIAAVAVAFVAIALFDRLLIGPTMSKLAAIDQDITKEKDVIKQDMHFLGHKARIVKENQLYDGFFTKQVPSDEEITAAFLKKVEELAQEAKVDLAKVTPVPGQQEADRWKYQADLECSGQLADIITFMHLVDTSQDLLKVVKFNITAKKSETDDVKASMTLSKIVVTPLGVAMPKPVVPQDDSKAPSSSAK